MSEDIKQQLSVMAHLVLGYPTLEESIRTAEAYIAAGCAILELQIPFSHPTADGPVITRACQVAVEQQHVGVDACLDVISGLKTRFPNQEMIVMSYLNRIYAYGTERFIERLGTIGIRHLIIPDLPVDSPLAQTMHNSAGVRLVPVIAANIPEIRLRQLLDSDYDFYYLMSDFKITGSTFSLNPRLKEIISIIRKEAVQSRVGIGFGISSAAQIEEVLEVADVAIIGSALIRARDESRLQAYLKELQSATGNLLSV